MLCSIYSPDSEHDTDAIAFGRLTGGDLSWCSAPSDVPPPIGRTSLYTNWMSIKLSIANRYLRDPELREKTVTRSVATSSAIEGIRAPFTRGAQTGVSSKIRLKRKKS